jgi:hypothetical protein
MMPHDLLINAGGGTALASLSLLIRHDAGADRGVVNLGCLPSSLTHLKLKNMLFGLGSSQAWRSLQLPRLQELRLHLAGVQLTSMAAKAFIRWVDQHALAC